MPIVWNDIIKVFPNPNMVTDIVTVQLSNLIFSDKLPVSQ